MISDMSNCCKTGHQKRRISFFSNFAWKVSGRSNVFIIS